MITFFGGAGGAPEAIGPDDEDEDEADTFAVSAGRTAAGRFEVDAVRCSDVSMKHMYLSCVSLNSPPPVHGPTW